MAPREPPRSARLLRLPVDSGAEEDSRRFIALVRDALLHLHELRHLDSHSLAKLIPRDQVANARGAGRALRQSLLDAIESLRPPRGASRQSHAWRTYRLLSERYVEARSTSDVQAALGISSSAYHVDHRAALEGLALLLQSAWQTGSEDDVRESPSSAAPADDPLFRAADTAEWAHSLPVSLTSFVGREREMAEVKRLLGQTRLLTLTGAGGCGKTRLALECARSILDTYPDGIWLAQLAPLADPALVPQTVGSALGIRERADEPILTTLKARLRGKHSLIVLDNCEHLLDSCARLAEVLLETCPALSILATSRQPLGIAGETTLHIPSLDSPSVDDVTREGHLEAVLSYDASRLFLDRARSALPSFDATVANAPAIGEICRRLDGIPLAIELAAARVRVLSPDQIAARLDHDFHLLTSGSRAALPRQQTLKATLDWSHNLLSEQERALLRRLSVFAGGFTLEAAEGICAGEGVEEVDVVNLLAELVDRSLVEADTREGNVRYRLLEPIRQYAWHRLEESGETDQIQSRHASWLAEHIRKAEDEFYGPAEAAWLKRVGPEIDNVRVALAWCLGHDSDIGLLLASSGYPFWVYRGLNSERHRWLDRLLALSPRPSEARARVLNSAAAEASHEGDYARATALASEALSILLDVGSEYLAGWCMNRLGIVAAVQGDRERARSLLERAEAIGRKHGNAKSLAETLVFAGWAAWLAGDYPRARRLSDEGLTAWRAIDTPSVGYAHFVVGSLACSEGDYPRARAHLEEGLEAFRSTWLLPGMGYCLSMLGLVSLREGDPERARRDLEEGLRLVAPPALRPRISRFLTFLALLAIREGYASRAARLIGAAQALNPSVRAEYPPDQVADLDACLAEARSALGEEAFARAWAEGKAMRQQEAVEYALQG